AGGTKARTGPGSATIGERLVESSRLARPWAPSAAPRTIWISSCAEMTEESIRAGGPNRSRAGSTAGANRFGGLASSEPPYLPLRACPRWGGRKPAEVKQPHEGS